MVALWHRCYRTTLQTMLCKRGIRCHAVSVRPSVCLSDMFVYSVKTNKNIFKLFSPSGSHAILVFPYQTPWQYYDGDPLTGASNADGVGKNSRFSTNIWLSLE